MSDEPSGPVTLEQLRAQLRRLTQAIRDAEEAYDKAVENAADAEGAYRSELAKAFRRHRQNGTGAGEAETLARADVVLSSRERDVAQGAVRGALDRMQNRRDDRWQVWRMVDVMRPRGAGEDERAPGSEWP